MRAFPNTRLDRNEYLRFLSELEDRVRNSPLPAELMKAINDAEPVRDVGDLYAPR